MSADIRVASFSPEPGSIAEGSIYAFTRITSPGPNSFHPAYAFVSDIETQLDADADNDLSQGQMSPTVRKAYGQVSVEPYYVLGEETVLRAQFHTPDFAAIPDDTDRLTRATATLLRGFGHNVVAIALNGNEIPHDTPA